MIEIALCDDEDIQEQFNKVAEEYDKNRKYFIPCFDDFYITTTNIITSQISRPNRILDLGSGTGLLANYWFLIIIFLYYV